MIRSDIEREINELTAEIPEWEKMDIVDEVTRVRDEISLFQIALTRSDDEITSCQVALPGRASVLRMAAKYN